MLNSVILGVLLAVLPVVEQKNTCSNDRCKVCQRQSVPTTNLSKRSKSSCKDKCSCGKYCKCGKDCKCGKNCRCNRRSIVNVKINSITIHVNSQPKVTITDRKSCKGSCCKLKK